MSEPDLDEIARRYLDLWQDQLAAMAADSTFAESAAKLLTLMSLGPAAWAPSSWFAGTAPGHPAGEGASDWNRGNDVRARAAARAAPAGTKTTAASPRDSDGELARLARRLAAIEKRLAALERGARPAARDGRTRARRRKSRSAR